MQNAFVCKKEFKTKPCYLNTGRGKHCSYNCGNKTKKKYKVWNEGLEGVCKSNRGSFTSDTMKGSLNPSWKGDSVGYSALHNWVGRNLGKAKYKECVYCGSSTNVQWANINGEYKRDLSDWIPLCYLCHRKYDMRNIWGKARQRFPEGW